VRTLEATEAAAVS